MGTDPHNRRCVKEADLQTGKRRLKGNKGVGFLGGEQTPKEIPDWGEKGPTDRKKPFMDTWEQKQSDWSGIQKRRHQNANRTIPLKRNWEGTPSENTALVQPKKKKDEISGEGTTVEGDCRCDLNPARYLPGGEQNEKKLPHRSAGIFHFSHPVNRKQSHSKGQK